MSNKEYCTNNKEDKRKAAYKNKISLEKDIIRRENR
jgi:hypothetical protein